MPTNSSRSWITYYFQWRFNIEKGKLGSIFFVTQILAAMSMIVASSIAKRLGNVKVIIPHATAVSIFYHEWMHLLLTPTDNGPHPSPLANLPRLNRRTRQCVCRALILHTQCIDSINGYRATVCVPRYHHLTRGTDGGHGNAERSQDHGLEPRPHNHWRACRS